MPVCSRAGISRHLPHVINAVSETVTPSQGAKIGHACPIWASDKGMVNMVSASTCLVGRSHYPPCSVYSVSETLIFTQSAKIGHAHAIGAGNKGMERA